MLAQKPEVVVLNKSDALPQEEVSEKQEVLEKAIGKKVFVMSAVAKKGIFDCLLAVNKYITRDRKKKDEAEAFVAEEPSKPWSPLN